MHALAMRYKHALYLLPSTKSIARPQKPGIFRNPWFLGIAALSQSPFAFFAPLAVRVEKDVHVLENCWVRIDDRLIHGQVTVGWRQRLRFDRIWVVDDALQADPIVQDVLCLAAPPGVQVRVCGIEEAARALLAGAGTGRCLVLLKSPAAALALVEAEVPLERLNVGNVAAGPGSRRVFKSVSLTQKQAAALDALSARGVRIVFQQIPEDPAVEWGTLRRRVL